MRVKMVRRAGVRSENEGENGEKNRRGRWKGEDGEENRRRRVKGEVRVSSSLYTLTDSRLILMLIAHVNKQLGSKETVTLMVGGVGGGCYE
ncbi:hypothetical protein Pmani_026459 [Petrolisthes manimaculis]|uniref:Uncharacterized protein n=1 Tax=Petrolisthes manimaculis TaxID=1843537 RepID=A0AAE1P554_9EUCA|nr:hypothetical protein Pmani_026459 [Petrolisthes manimaculis]